MTLRSRAAGEHAGHAHGARAGAAGERLAGAALPGALPQLAAAEDLHELAVHAFRETADRLRAAGRCRAPSRRSARRRTSTQCGLPIETEVTRNSRPPTASGTSTTGSSGPRGRAEVSSESRSGIKIGSPMSTRTWSTLPCATFNSSVQHPAGGLDLQRVAAADAVVVDVLGDAADAVAAHLGGRAVGVEHPHLGVGPLRWGRSGSGRRRRRRSGGRTCGGPARECSVGHGFGEAIDVDVVVAGAVHLGEVHGKGRSACRDSAGELRLAGRTSGRNRRDVAAARFSTRYHQGDNRRGTPVRSCSAREIEMGAALAGGVAALAVGGGGGGLFFASCRAVLPRGGGRRRRVPRFPGLAPWCRCRPLFRSGRRRRSPAAWAAVSRLARSASLPPVCERGTPAALPINPPSDPTLICRPPAK